MSAEQETPPEKQPPSQSDRIVVAESLRDLADCIEQGGIAIMFALFTQKTSEMKMISLAETPEANQVFAFIGMLEHLKEKILKS